MLQTHTIDLKLFKINLELHRVLAWAWYYRWHLKRYVKRYVPSKRLTCDVCGTDIVAWLMKDSYHGNREEFDKDPWWYAGCPRCMDKIAWGHFAGASTEEAALDEWARTGGKEFTESGVSFRVAPPWLWEDEDSLGLNKIYKLLKR
ncbi:hypothetical protein LCGC14_1312020 [marine sediment metagenome]|uniref:Uncharacterized protein n=1 Tax=marine sediment metagenome TaxID=412755 RepID=A0A0F9KM11_9ZZZZ